MKEKKNLLIRGSLCGDGEAEGDSVEIRQVSCQPHFLYRVSRLIRPYNAMRHTGLASYAI